MDAAESIRERYQGERGKQYHQGVHHNDDSIQQVVARERARKYRPHVGTADEVFEYGAGLCTNIRFLECARRVAFDLSDAGRDIAVRHGIEFHTDLAAIAGRRFDVVICSHTLEHVPDPLTVLEQLKSFVKPGERLLLSVPFETDRSYRRYRPDDPNHHIYAWNPLALGNLVADAGFNVVSSEVRPFGYEQRLAKLTRFGDATYRAMLWAARHVKPFNECFLVARAPR